MLRAMLLGYNGIVLQSDTDGNLTSVDTATEYPSESESNDGYFDSVLLLGIHNNELIPS